MSTRNYTPAPIANAFSLDIESLEPNPFQPRSEFKEDQMRDLSASIEVVGVLQPILARLIRGKENLGIFYQIVDGERRWRASQMANKSQIPAIAREMTDEQVLYACYVANDQREDLSDKEKSDHFVFIAMRGAELGVEPSIREIAQQMGRSTTYVRNRFNLQNLKPDCLAVANRRNGVMSHLFLIDPLPKEERTSLLSQVDKPNPIGFRVLKKQVEDINTRSKAKSESQCAPDEETAVRSYQHEASGGGSVSRGRVVSVIGEREARREMKDAISSIDSKITTFEQWGEHAPRVLDELKPELYKLLKRLEGLSK